MFLIWDDEDDDDDDDDDDDGAGGGGGDGDGVIVIMMIKWLVFRGKLKSATRGRVCFFEHIGLLNITRKWQLEKAHYKSCFISAVVVGHHCSHAPCTDLGAPYLMPAWNPMVFYSIQSFFFRPIPAATAEYGNTTFDGLKKIQAVLLMVRICGWTCDKIRCQDTGNWRTGKFPFCSVFCWYFGSQGSNWI